MSDVNSRPFVKGGGRPLLRHLLSSSRWPQSGAPQVPAVSALREDKGPLVPPGGPRGPGGMAAAGPARACRAPADLCACPLSPPQWQRRRHQPPDGVQSRSQAPSTGIQGLPELVAPASPESRRRLCPTTHVFEMHAPPHPCRVRLPSSLSGSIARVSKIPISPLNLVVMIFTFIDFLRGNQSLGFKTVVLRKFPIRIKVYLHVGTRDQAVVFSAARGCKSEQRAGVRGWGTCGGCRTGHMTCTYIQVPGSLPVL